MPVVAIVGRPNVGKSSLFNRLLGQRRAIVADLPGTTRDRVTGEATWGGRTLTMVDTGGLVVEPDSSLWAQVKLQVEAAMAEADVIIFVTDAAQGIMPGDLQIADLLRRSGKPVVLAANKVDNPRRDLLALELYELGLGDPVPVSAYHNLGIDDLVASVLAALPRPFMEVEAAKDILHLAIVGRTNVGKSMLLNAILGEERAIVNEMPGTTRDALDTPFRYGDQAMVLIDTAGIRRRGHIQPGVEQFSVLRALDAVRRCDVALVVLDASELATAQDLHVAGVVVESFKGMVVVVNKWDMAPELELDAAEVRQSLLERLKFMPHAPIRFASALRREGISEVLDACMDVYRDRMRWIPHGHLQKVVMEAASRHLPPKQGSRVLRIRGVRQEGVNPPSFTFFINNPDLAHFSYQRYLENALRRAFGFRGSRLRMEFRGRQASRVGGQGRGKGLT